MNEELTEMVVRDLGKHRSRNEIIRSVAEQGEMDWRQAEQFILKVEQEHGHTIARKQGPFLILLSVGTLLIGILLLVSSIDFFLRFFQGDALDMLLSASSGYYKIIGTFTGIGMIIGGLIGVWKTVIPLFDE